MPPQEPEPSGTSLELTEVPDTAAAGGQGSSSAGALAGTSLELPSTSPAEPSEPQHPGPALPAPVPAPAPRPVPDQDGAGMLGNLVTAHLRRVEVAMLGRVLVSTLSGALPASMVRVERRRTRFGRAAEPIGITITAGHRMLSLRAPEVGVVEAGAGHVVRGVVLSSTPMPVAQWLDELAAVLDDVTREDEVTRAALERAFLS